MKLKMAIITVVLIIISSISSISAAPYSAMLTGAVQVDQTTSYYCGPATAQIVLQWPGSSWYVDQVRQQDLASSEELNCVSPNYDTAWYYSGNDINTYVMSKTLNGRKGYTAYYPYTYGYPRPTITFSGVRTRVLTTIGDNSMAIAASGESYGDEGDMGHLPGYPTYSIGHWICAKGYDTNGYDVFIADPAASPAVSFGDDVDPQYWLDLYSFTTFLQNNTHGIIQNTAP